MKTSRLISLLIALSCLAGCAGKGGPGGPESEERTGPSFQGRHITVQEFGLAGASIHNPESTTAMGLAIAEQIAARLDALGIAAAAIPSRATPPAGDVVVGGDVTLIEAGSRAQRYWVGFGAGAAKFGVRGWVRDGSPTDLATFQRERWSGFGIFGGSSVNLVQQCMEAVARDIAKMIETGKYTTH